MTIKNNLIQESLRLMVVDDNVDAAETFSALLEMQGHNLHTAHDGFDAIKIANAFKPHVVFLDIAMPDMNGYETAEELRRILGAENVVLIALTGWEAEADRIKSTNTIFNYHFTKPIKIDEINTLLSTINRETVKC